MIPYFTGTGNCLYAARELAAEGESVLSTPRNSSASARMWPRAAARSSR